MSANAAGAGSYRPKSQKKLIFFAIFGVVTVFVTYMKNRGFFDPASPTAKHFEPALTFVLMHGFFAAIALLLGIFQLSNRLRARYLALHRKLGYVYATCVFIGAPLAVPLAARTSGPTLTTASVVQATGWMICTAIALYCVRNGNIVQHRRWMIRSFAFAMIFTAARLVIGIPPVLAMGETGIEMVVWSCIAAAAFLPTVYLDWRLITTRPKAKQTMETALQEA